MRAVQLPRALAAPQEVAAAVVPVLTVGRSGQPSAWPLMLAPPPHLMFG